MRSPLTILLALLAVWLSSCAGSAGPAQPGSALMADEIAISALHGSSVEGAVVSVDGQDVLLKINTVRESGHFLHLTLPTSLSSYTEQWIEDTGLLHLVAASGNGLDIGIVPLRGFNQRSVTLRLSLSNRAKAASEAPSGIENVVRDLKVIELGEGKVRLEWTEINVGDYDLNGEVNIADLTPMGKYFGIEYGQFGWPQAQVADGDGNFSVDIADLTPIGRNYGASIAGYLVRRDSEPLPSPDGDLPTVERIVAPDLASFPKYVVELEGNVDDLWTVAPVDQENNEGPDADPFYQDRMDLSVSLEISGAELLKLDGSGAGQFGPGFSTLRVIDDIDLPYRWDSDTWQGIMAEGSFGATLFNEVPRGNWLLLDICYAPVIDLATGADKGVSGTRGASELNPADIVTTSIPFRLPAGLQQLKIVARVDLLPVNPAEPNLGYYVDLDATFTTLDGSTRQLQRLDYKNGLLASDLDTALPDGYDDSAWLADPDRDCVSTALLDNLDTDDTYSSGIIEPVLLKGFVQEFNEAAGTLTIYMPQQFFGFDWMYLPVDSLEIDFSEGTSFARLEQGDYFDFDPGTVEPNQTIQFEGSEYTFESAGLPVRYWMNNIILLSN